MAQESCPCWLVAKEMGEKPPEEEKPAELYPIMGLAQKRTRKDLFEVCLGMLSTCNQQLASAYSMIECVIFRYGASIAIVLPPHINKTAYIFQLPMAWSEHRTSLMSENCPNRNRPRDLCHTKWSAESISLVRYISMLAACEWNELHRCKREMPHEHYSGGWYPRNSKLALGDRIRTEILATVREKGILEQSRFQRKENSGDRCSLYPCPINHLCIGASILGLSIY